MDNIRRRRNVDALDEYRRIFASRIDRQYRASSLMSGGQISLSQLAQKESDHAQRAQSRWSDDGKGKARKTDRLHLKRTGTGGSRSGIYSHVNGNIPALMLLALLRGYHTLARARGGGHILIVVTLVCAASIAGAYFYRIMRSGGGGTLPVIPVEQASGADSSESAEDRKLYDRLTPDTPENTTPLPVAPAVAVRVQSQYSGYPADAPLLRRKPSGDAPSFSPFAARRTNIGPPNEVQPEAPLLDGVPADTAKPAVIPSIVRLNSGRTQPPILEAAKPPALPAEASPPIAAPAPEGQSASATVSPVQAAPALASPPDSDYFVQVKSDQDKKAADDELAAVAEKYKPILGQVPLITRSVDLKIKGIWFRVLAGPLRSREEAAGLCEKLKSAGLPGCLVNKSE